MNDVFLGLELYELLVMIVLYLVMSSLSYGLALYTTKAPYWHWSWALHVTLWLVWPLVIFAMCIYFILEIPLNLVRGYLRRRHNVRHRKARV